MLHIGVLLRGCFAAYVKCVLLQLAARHRQYSCSSSLLVPSNQERSLNDLSCRIQQHGYGTSGSQGKAWLCSMAGWERCARSDSALMAGFWLWQSLQTLFMSLTSRLASKGVRQVRIMPAASLGSNTCRHLCVVKDIDMECPFPLLCSHADP